MGSIRTLLALVVVFQHTAGSLFVGGQLAVQLFYLISGFLISYILVEAKSYRSVGSFYANRALRIFPLYFLVAVPSFLFLVAVDLAGVETRFLDVYRAVGPGNALFLAATNLLVFGQDWLMFLKVSDGALAFATNFKASPQLVYDAAIIPQAWTLGLELSFYLIAPFVLTRKRWLFGLLIASLLVRVALYRSGLFLQDPWTYRFFPAELCFFLLGAIAHQYLRPAYARALGRRLPIVAVVVTGLVAVQIAAHPWLPYQLAATALLFVTFVLALPLLFAFQGGAAWDRRIGELSFPLYISHMMVVLPYRLFVIESWANFPLGHAVVAIALSIALALVLDRVASAPIETVRARFRGQPVTPASPTKPELATF